MVTKKEKIARGAIDKAFGQMLPVGWNVAQEVQAAFETTKPQLKEDVIAALKGAGLLDDDDDACTSKEQICGLEELAYELGQMLEKPDNVKIGLDCYIPEFRLFRELSKRDRKLTKRDVLLILKWKLGRLKDNAAKVIEDNNFERINEAIAVAQSSEDEQKLKALKMLMDIPGIKLATATAILTVCHPKEFTIIDRRVLEQLGYSGRLQETSAWTPEEYLRTYLPQVKECSRQWNTTLRDTDRALWGLSVDHKIDELLKGSGGS